jgi:hypothetical protein
MMEISRNITKIFIYQNAQLPNMANLYPCLFCEAVFVHPTHAKDHIKDCHSRNERITITHHEDMNSSL